MKETLQVNHEFHTKINETSESIETRVVGLQTKQMYPKMSRQLTACLREIQTKFETPLQHAIII